MSGLCSAPPWITASIPRSAKIAVDQRAVGDRAEDVGLGTGRDVEPDDVVPVCAQPRCEEAAEPAGGACQEYAHVTTPSFQRKLECRLFLHGG